MRATYFLNFSCWNKFFYDCQCLKCTVEQRRLHENHIAHRLALIHSTSGFFFKKNVRNPVWICRDPIFSHFRDPNRVPKTSYKTWSTCSWNLQSELKVTHEKTPIALPRFKNVIFGTITSCRKIAVVLKLRKVIFAKFFTSTAKT